MATSDVEKLIKNLTLAWSSPNALDKFLFLFTDDCVYEDVATGAIVHGKTELAQFYQQGRSAFPDFKIEVTSSFGTSHRAGAEWIASGTHRGDLPELPATNKPFSLRGASIFELLDNRVKRCSDYSDMAALLRQLGVLPAASNS
jgi:steroid delta-isomerase-like uncharacterized protein